MATRDIILIQGQSNANGISNGPVPSGIPISGLGNVLWPRNMSGSRATAPVALLPLNLITGSSENYMGIEQQLGLDLYNAGQTAFGIIKVSKDGTAAALFLSPSANWTDISTNVGNALAALVAAFPNDTFRYHLVFVNGESEVQDPSSAGADALDTTIRTLWSGINGLISKVATIHVCRVNSLIGTPTNLATVRAKQVLFRWVSQDGLPGYDTLHYDNTGYNALGSRVTLSILGNRNRTTLTVYTRNRMVGTLRGTASTRAATLYLAAARSGAELVANGFSRLAITNNTTNFPNAAVRTKFLASDQTFSAVTGSNQTVDELRLYDASSGGNIVASWTLDAVTTVNVGQSLYIPGYQLSLTGQAGGVTDAPVEGLLNHEFGGPDYTTHATSYFVYCTSDPRSGGSEAGARVSNANNNTKWAAASSGSAATSADITITDQVTAHVLAEYDAVVAGNLISVGSFSFTPNTGKIAAGLLVTSFT